MQSCRVLSGLIMSTVAGALPVLVSHWWNAWNLPTALPDYSTPQFSLNNFFKITVHIDTQKMCYCYRITFLDGSM